MKIVVFILVQLSFSFVLFAQKLPDLFISKNGTKVETINDWNIKRKPELLSILRNEIYGEIPSLKNFKISYQTLEKPTWSVKHEAIREQIVITITNTKGSAISIDVLIYYPKNKTKVPVFVNLNWIGNQSVTTEKEVKLCNAKIFEYQPEEHGIINFKASEKSRGEHQSRLPIDSIIKAGYGIITACYQDICPDINEDYRQIATSFFCVNPDSTGAISLWAFQHSLLAQYISKRNEPFDTNKIMIVGHSRLGKAALWAAANNSSITMVFSNESGCTGASLTNHDLGESIRQINTSFPHWFKLRYKYYNDKDTLLPFDQHFLLATIAPRYLYVSSAHEDPWADPESEYLATKETEKVYQFLGLKTDLPITYNTQLKTSRPSNIGYHVRGGIHDLTPQDWKYFILFAKMNFNGKND